MKGVLILSMDESVKIVKKTDKLNFMWNDEELDNVNSYITKIPSFRGTRIYYSSSGHYFFLDKYTDVLYYTLKLMKIFKLNRRRYKICKFKSNTYYMFECLPDNENFVKKKDNLTYEEKLITIFHWILGVKGKLWCRFIDGYYEVFSIGPYNINYEKSKLKKIDVKRLFTDKSEMREFGEYFTENIERARDLLQEEYYWWFYQISKRIRLLL